MLLLNIGSALPTSASACRLHHSGIHSGPDFTYGYIGLNPGPQDPSGPPTNCDTHRVNGRCQWRSKAKCRPEPTIKVPPFQPLKFAYKNFK